MTWGEFRDRLRVSLRSLTDRCCVVVVASDERGCVQFFGTVDVLSAEASGPEVVGGAAVHGPNDPTMLAAGWEQSTRAPPNWSFDLPLPAMTSEYAALADRCVIALRDVFHLADPAELAYHAWREPDVQPAGVTWSPEQFDRLDPGEDPLPMPAMGLQPQSA